MFTDARWQLSTPLHENSLHGNFQTRHFLFDHEDDVDDDDDDDDHGDHNHDHGNDNDAYDGNCPHLNMKTRYMVIFRLIIFALMIMIMMMISLRVAIFSLSKK